MLPTSKAGREGGRRRKFLTENETASKRKHVKYSAVRLLLDINWFVEFFNIPMQSYVFFKKLNQPFVCMKVS